jgi:hypothetical protein
LNERKPCKDASIWLSGFQPDCSDTYIFTGRCPALLPIWLSAKLFGEKCNFILQVREKSVALQQKVVHKNVKKTYKDVYNYV